MIRQRHRAFGRRLVIAGGSAGILGAAIGRRGVLAQPVAPDALSFYLGQTLALATLQAEAIRRLRPFLAVPAPADVDWQATTTAEAGVIGAVAGVLGAMAAPPELTASVGELRLASEAYQRAAAAAQRAAAGETVGLGDADAGLTEGATHILLWLEALTAETGNDWGDGLRTLTLGAAPAPAVEIAMPSAAEEPMPPVADDPGDGTAIAGEAEARGRAQPRRLRRDRRDGEDRVGREGGGGRQ